MSRSAPIEPKTKNTTLPESLSSGEVSPERLDSDNYRRFRDLRGVQWRIDLGILPCSSSSIDHFRRVTANCRRSYAALRRRLLINPHISKDDTGFRDLVMDNPLSQNPESIWGRFFHKAELEKMVDQDLCRLYPEHGSYFQTPGCQGVLRRVLLLWCIRHPNYGYRQGMHELLAPLLYVLQADLERLSEVRKQYKDYFTDNFDGLSFDETDLEEFEDSIGSQKDQEKVNSLNDLDQKIQTIISFCDAYGAEGELGIVLSEKFIEHDAYSMFDALMNGNGGAVSLASFFSHSPSPQNGLPPVIEASSALYHLLSVVDFSLYTHLVELGVEPQYFSLRWLRVLFGREFALEGLLVIWDEIFELDNNRINEGYETESEVNFGVLKSTRGAFISALAVSMILYLRSSLLATENATLCLQRLLNFPEDVNLGKLLKKAKSLMNLAIDAMNSMNPELSKPRVHGQGLGHSRSSDLSHLNAPGSLTGVVPESYWEEKWRVMNKEQEQKQGGLSKQVQNRIKGWSEKVKMRLTRTESAQFLSKVTRSKSPVRRNLITDLANDKSLGENVYKETIFSNENGASEEENFSVYSDPLSPRALCANNNINDHGNDTEISSVASNSSVTGIDPSLNPSPSLSPSIASGLFSSTEDVASPLPVSDPPEDLTFKEVKTENITGDPVSNLREKRPLSGKFQWLWMFSKNGPDGSSEKCEFDQKPAASSSTIDETSKRAAVDHNNLKYIAQSILENIEVIETVFQQEKVQTEHYVENLSKDAMSALKELRKISKLLSETR